MPSLRSLVARHRTVLLIDSSATSIQVGLWHSGRESERVDPSVSGGCEHERVAPPLPEAIWHTANQEAGIAIFAGVDAVLAQSGIGVTDVGAFVFCEGPGSILGIRSAAMALRIWLAANTPSVPAFAYRSLELVAHDLRRRGLAAPAAVIADARRDTWHWVEIPTVGAIGPLQRVPTAVAAGFVGGLHTPGGFRAWAKPPGEVAITPYVLADLWRHQGEADLLRAAPKPDAFLHEDATYATWTPQIHRAGASSSQTRAGA
jgi:tRNA threonylcarbamoyladenosine biosynthesis protein TsaB